MPLTETSTNKTVVKSVELLNLFLTNSRLTLTEMVQLLQAPKTSVYRMARSLEDMGFLTKGPDNKYALGLLFLQFGKLVSERLEVRHVALPIMKRLRDEVDEAVNLIIPDGGDAIYIEKLDTNHPVRVYTQVGRRAPMYAGACPRILLTHLPEEELERYLARTELLPFASGTITDRYHLREVLDESRRTGYTVSHSELEDHTSAVAAPIRDHSGLVIAGLSIAGPTSRFQAEHLPPLVEACVQGAQEISMALGWRAT
ncbi:IclR family transcriptional regulator [Tumebacillus flagellatus]|uniref:IclR family transcriptional regulator n=1 Tax=Tumebacillus flagellatus TaxID=1157490 RepID=A0A074MG92_9BACL|nr:IclR family transcriptional regulator [Tumebacillus flagellatus]KEO84727.1 IclR family transcriptional regulator [Tumebacillus flagellatus]